MQRTRPMTPSPYPSSPGGPTVARRDSASPIFLWGFAVFLLALLGPLRAQAQTPILEGLETDPARLPEVVDDYQGNLFAAAVVDEAMSPPGANPRTIRVTKQTIDGSLPWGADGVALNTTLPIGNGTGGVTLALQPDLAGGVYVFCLFEVLDGDPASPQFVDAGLLVGYVPNSGAATTLSLKLNSLDGMWYAPDVHLAVTTAGTGSAYVTYLTAVGAPVETQLVWERYNPQGLVSSGDVFVDTPDFDPWGTYEIVRDGNEGFYCLYVGHQVGASPFGFGLFAQRVYSDTTTWVTRGLASHSGGVIVLDDLVDDVVPLYDVKRNGLLAIWSKNLQAFAWKLNENGVFHWGFAPTMVHDATSSLPGGAEVNQISAEYDDNGGFVMAHGYTEVWAQRVVDAQIIGQPFPQPSFPWGLAGALVDTTRGAGFDFPGFAQWEEQQIRSVGPDVYALTWNTELSDPADAVYVKYAEIEKTDGSKRQERVLRSPRFNGTDVVFMPYRPRMAVQGVDQVRVMWLRTLWNPEPGFDTEFLESELEVVEPPVEPAPPFEIRNVGAFPSNQGGVGAGWADVDGDEDLDLYVAGIGAGSSRFFRNDDGTFVDATTPLLQMDGIVVRAVTWADFDGDEDMDLFIGAETLFQSRLLRNDGAGNFADVTFLLPFAGPFSPSCGSASFVNYDGDDDLDLFTTGSNQNAIWSQNPDGTFSYVLPLGLAGSNYGVTQSAEWADYNNDGNIDAYFVELLDNNLLILGIAPGLFADVTDPTTAGTEYTRTAAWGNFDGDPDMDLFVGNTQGDNLLLRNDGTMFQLVTPSIVAATGDAFTSSWVDFDNTGTLDLYVGGTGSDFLLVNDGNGNFTNGPLDEVDTSDQTNAAIWGDYDADGDQDLFLSQENGLLLVHNNLKENESLSKTASSSWISFDGSGSRPGHEIAGTRIRVVANGQTQIRDLVFQGGWSGQRTVRPWFGLGSAAVVDTVEIRTPDGEVSVQTDVTPNATISLDPGTATAVPPAMNAASFRLLAPAPNPFNPRTSIRFEIEDPSTVSLTIFDSAGRRIRTLVGGVQQPSGIHQVVWDGVDDRGRNVASGVYHLRMEARGAAQSKRLVLVR